MIIDEIKENIPLIQEMCGIESPTVILYKDCMDALDKLQSDFESRTCENCNLHDGLQCKIIGDMCMYIEGCNKWERKDD